MRLTVKRLLPACLVAATSIAAYLGARVFRTHDVPGTLATLEMVASIVGTRPPARTVRGLA